MPLSVRVRTNVAIAVLGDHDDGRLVMRLCPDRETPRRHRSVPS
jgi:hypothetical protein